MASVEDHENQRKARKLAHLLALRTILDLSNHWLAYIHTSFTRAHIYTHIKQKRVLGGYCLG